MQCSSCDTFNPETARFCMQCGQPLNAALPEPPRIITGERRVVSVLFADLAGFTSLAEQLDPEQVHQLINACFDCMVPVVERYGGTIDKFIGDEVMALFGAPVAHEDDPVRAVRAALGMFEALEQFNADHQTQLGLHIGINTGLVVASGIGSQGRQQYSVIGDAVNLAARLVAQAPTGEIYVGEDTFRATAPLFEYVALASIHVKGRTSSVTPYRLIGFKARPERLRGLVGLYSSLVGRDQELAQVLELSRNIDRARAVVFVGEAGMGKSRLLAEWNTALEHEPIRWAEGHCSAYGESLAYHLVRDLVRSLAGIPSTASDPEARTLLARAFTDLPEQQLVVPALQHLLLLGSEASLDGLDPIARQSRYIEALQRILSFSAQQQPVVLILEDLHWADSSSIELLQRVLPTLGSSALLIGVTSRPEYETVGWQFVQTLQQAWSQQTTMIQLDRLSLEASRSMVANLLEIESLSPELRQLIVSKADGNPLFVEEIIRTLIDQQLIRFSDGRWVAQATIVDVDIPDQLQGLLLSRIDRLPEDVQQTLRVAAVIGRQFPRRVLEEVLRSVADESASTA